MKPWLPRNMLLNINTCENGWSNFSANLRVVSLKLLQLTQFAWPNLSIYINFLCAVPPDDVIESTRFLMRPPVIHSTMLLPIHYHQRGLNQTQPLIAEDSYSPKHWQLINAQWPACMYTQLAIQKRVLNKYRQKHNRNIESCRSLCLRNGYVFATSSNNVYQLYIHIM